MYHIDGKMLQMEGDSGLEKFTVGPNKARKPNWTENEVTLLLEEYSKRRHFMKPKFGTTVPVTERQKCWSEIADQINASEGMNGCYRSIKEVQKKWENLSNRMRSEFATAKVDPTLKLSDTSIAINNILNGDGTFDANRFTKGYMKVKQEKFDDADFLKDEDSFVTEETTDDIPNGPREPVPVLNIPFKANSRFQKSLDTYVPIAPRVNQIYSSFKDQKPVTSSNTSKPNNHTDQEVVFPSGDSVCVTSPSTLPGQTIAEYDENDNPATAQTDRPKSETSAKLKVMLKRANCLTNSVDSDPPRKKPDLDIADRACPILSDKSVAQLYKQVLILKKRTLKQNLEKLELEKVKLKLETEKLKIEKETAKICRDKSLTELLILKQKFSAFI